MNSHLNRSFQWLESQITQIAAGNKKVFFHKMKKLFFMIFICILIILFFPFFLFVRMFSKCSHDFQSNLWKSDLNFAFLRHA